MEWEFLSEWGGPLIFGTLALYFFINEREKLRDRVSKHELRIRELETQVFLPISKFDEDYKMSNTLKSRVRDLEYEMFNEEKGNFRDKEIKSLRSEFFDLIREMKQADKDDSL